MQTAGKKDHFGKFEMGAKVLVTLYGRKLAARVCYTSERAAKDGCTMVEFPDRVGDWCEVVNENISAA